MERRENIPTTHKKKNVMTSPALAGRNNLNNGSDITCILILYQLAIAVPKEIRSFK
jgi:hypothetical protein